MRGSRGRIITPERGIVPIPGIGQAMRLQSTAPRLIDRSPILGSARVLVQATRRIRTRRQDQARFVVPMQTTLLLTKLASTARAKTRFEAGMLDRLIDKVRCKAANITKRLPMAVTPDTDPGTIAVVILG